jgi:hypothetical protein
MGSGRNSRLKISSCLVGTFMAVGTPVTPVASASYYDINGVYAATSNGQWAQTNHQYHDEPSVVSRWTISTHCTSPYDCRGTVHSDLGWDATIYTQNQLWYIVRDVPDWEPCPDGSHAGGTQTYMFYPVGDDGMVAMSSNTFAGYDKTIGQSGACGVNKWIAVELPFKLVKVD